MTYDATGERVLLFGGFNPNEGLRGDLWAWDGSEWVELEPQADDGPSGRSFSQIVYDADQDRVVVFGGFAAGCDGDRSGHTSRAGARRYHGIGRWRSARSVHTRCLAPGGLDILVVAGRERASAAAVDLEHAIRQGGEKASVVRNKQHGAGKTA